MFGKFIGNYSYKVVQINILIIILCSYVDFKIYKYEEIY